MAFYSSAIEEAKAQSKNVKVSVVRLAKVTSVSADGKAKVTFYGDSLESGKEYTYLVGFTPEVGSTVALIPQGDTYIILGAVSSEPPGETSPANKIKNELYSVSLEGNNLVPDTDKNINIGSDEKNFFNGRFANLYIGANKLRSEACSEISPKGTETSQYRLVMDSSGNLTPKSTRKVTLGSTSYEFKKIYVEEIEMISQYSANYKTLEISPESASATQIINNKKGKSQKVLWKADDSLAPDTNKSVSLGTSSYLFNNIYGSQLYQNSTAITTSDRRKKKTIKDVTKKYLDFFKKLRPVTYKYKDGDSGRLHTGFIAQEVEEAMQSSGINSVEFAGLIIDENGDYALRYEEFIALQTKVIQNLQTRIEELERRIK